MTGKYNNLTLIIRENPMGDYKYLIHGYACQGYEAYRTEKGFNQWLERTNLQMEFESKHHSNEYGDIEVYKLIGEIEEYSFWNMSDIPTDAKQFKGLSNGSYVDCYYLHTGNGAIIYRPNGNAKEVYKPLTIEEHLELQKEIG